MLLELLQQEIAIKRYIVDSCSENGISINVDPSIDKKNLLIIKVDRYYNHLTKEPKKSPDCLVIQRCAKNLYRIYIIELRNIKNQEGFKVDDIYEKFITCLEDFMSNRFANYFHNATFEYLKINLIFIADPYNYKNNPDRQLKMRGYKLDTLMSQRVPKFFGKHIYIDHKLPNPTIKNCFNK